ANHDVAEICAEIGADSLAFLSGVGLWEACRQCNPAADGFCQGCFTGEYPISVPSNDTKTK
ncbi:MAG: amidophosphoribosyltransferase, partial [Treponemataceae bacterium]|nr:amidophosphoribosyltransferase [Treponemataceae bacterium]